MTGLAATLSPRTSRMTSNGLVRAVLAIVLGFGVAASANAQATRPEPPAPAAAKPPAGGDLPAVEPSIEPRALEVLRASSSRLAAARTLRFTAVAFYESPSRLGPALVYATRSTVALQRPNKLRVITPADGPASEFYYDGRTMTAFAPAQNLVATAQAPPTIDAVLKAAYDSAGIYFPFTDVIVADPYRDIEDTLEIAFYIGRSRVVGGTVTDMVAYAGAGVFVQVWIGVDDKLPRMARAVFRNDPQRLRHQVEFSDWKLGGALPAGTFSSARAARARPMPFAHPDPGPGATPAPAAQPSKAP